MLEITRSFHLLERALENVGEHVGVLLGKRERWPDADGCSAARADHRTCGRTCMSAHVHIRCSVIVEPNSMHFNVVLNITCPVSERFPSEHASSNGAHRDDVRVARARCASQSTGCRTPR